MIRRVERLQVRLTWRRAVTWEIERCAAMWAVENLVVEKVLNVPLSRGEIDASPLE
jgi:hypothetical protein